MTELLKHGQEKTTTRQTKLPQFTPPVQSEPIAFLGRCPRLTQMGLKTLIK